MMERKRKYESVRCPKCHKKRLQVKYKLRANYTHGKKGGASITPTQVHVVCKLLVWNNKTEKSDDLGCGYNETRTHPPNSCRNLENFWK